MVKILDGKIVPECEPLVVGQSVANTKLGLEDVWDFARCFLSWNINYPCIHSGSVHHLSEQDHMMGTWREQLLELLQYLLKCWSVVMFVSQQDCKQRVAPPEYEDPPPYSDGSYLLVTRRLMAVLTLVIMILFSLTVALLIKHAQQLEQIKNNQNCVSECLSLK